MGEGNRDGQKKAKIERILIKGNGLLKGFRNKGSKKRLSHGRFCMEYLGEENCPRARRLNLLGFFFNLGKQELLQRLNQY